MTIQMRQGLPFIQVSLIHRHQQKIFNRVRLDTGSAGTFFQSITWLTLAYNLSIKTPSIELVALAVLSLSSLNVLMV